ncbi:hypothetical protein CS022_10780 [Veronia nyctiphanis]|uniref:SGNH hydrolase-type esterase domain-containing protein n=1 Tax=Veronia nyctiphanis TaxID=1278244 RepID=A0A4Q0YW42_9GAMM|nr:SGNH/GDSL hydrolase family protein [Veronia nyctiphanis]RXJ73221.1 hypothetical protein CS022_10780 [Veronia nyctiphanis]
MRAFLLNTLQLCLLPLLPVIIHQGKRVKKDTIRLPEASGSRTIGNRGDVSILHIGESTVAGVGVEDINDGLTANIVKSLETEGNIEAKAYIVGQNGSKISDILRLPMVDERIDVLVITLGVNDTVGLTPEKKWRFRIDQCVEKFGRSPARIFITEVPDMTKFPALPAPLSWFLGVRAKMLNLVLKDLCQQKGWYFISSNTPITTDWMAIDGYHPNGKGYQAWGAAVGEIIGKELSNR